MTQIEFVDLKRQYDSLKAELDQAVLDALASTDYILGNDVTHFEQEWADYCSVERCVGVSSGTAALELAYKAVGIGPGDEVIAPANTFIATVLPLLHLGALPVLVDCDKYGQIDVGAAAAAVTKRTKAIAGVDLFGHPCDADALESLCREQGLVFVEDAAQAHGAEYKGRRCGSLGDVATFSFYPGKNLGAAGDAGAVVTDDAGLAEKIKLLRDFGQSRKYEHVTVGRNERLDTLQAAVLRVKLRHLDRWTELRRRHAAAYTELLSDVVRTPLAAPWALPVWHLYVIRVANRQGLREALAERGIASGLHYPTPLHLQPALSALGHQKGDFPVAEDWATSLLSLPMFPELERAEVELVADVVNCHAAPLPA